MKAIMRAIPCVSLYKESLDENDCVDFRSPCEARPFPLYVENTVFYVRPETLAARSPVFRTMLLSKNFSEGRDGFARIQDESTEDIECLLQSICPFYLALYPKVVNAQTLPILMRFADKYLISALTDSCIFFLAKSSFTDLSPQLLINIFRVVREQKLDIDTQTRILVELLRFDSIELLREVKQETAVGKLVRNLLQHKQMMRHRLCYEEEVQGLQCSICRILPFNKRSRGRRSMHFCSNCRTELCQKCQKKICTKVVEQWLKELEDREED